MESWKWLRCSNNQSFKIRTGLAGQPRTRSTRAWNQSGWRQKPAWKLARRNPVDPAGQPGTRSTRSNPGETRLIYIYIMASFTIKTTLQSNYLQWKWIKASSKTEPSKIASLTLTLGDKAKNKGFKLFSRLFTYWASSLLW